MHPIRDRHPAPTDPTHAPARDRRPRWIAWALAAVLGAAVAPVAAAANVTLHVGGLTLHLDGAWSVEENPGLERSLLQGRRETTTQDGVTVTQTVFPDVRSIAAYAPDGAAVLVHAYRSGDVPPSREARATALEEAWNQQLLDVDVLMHDTFQVAGAPAQVMGYLATDPYDEARYRGLAVMLDGPEGPLLIVLEATVDDAERFATRFEAALAGATLDRPAPSDLVCCAIPPDPFVVSFSDGFVTLSLQEDEDGAGYVGEIEADGQRYPVRASASGFVMVGTLTSGGHEFPFVARFDRGTLVFQTGDTTYRLARVPEP